MVTTRNMKITKENNLTNKGIYIVKLVGQPLIKLVHIRGRRLAALAAN